MKHQITIALCENNHQGRACGLVTGIDFIYQDEVCLSFEAIDITKGEICITQPGGGIYYKKNHYPTGYRKDWAGNMLWNEYTASLQVGLNLLNAVITDRCFRVTQGWANLFEKTKYPPVTAADFGIPEDEAPELFNNPSQLNLFK